MPGFEGSLALKLDFGATTTTATAGCARRGRADLRLALGGLLRGPDKYKVLEHRRRQAQINARRQIDLLEGGSRIDGSTL